MRQEDQGDRNPGGIEAMVLAKWDRATERERDLIVKLLSDDKLSAEEAKRLDRFLSDRKKVSKAPKKGKRR